MLKITPTTEYPFSDPNKPDSYAALKLDFGTVIGSMTLKPSVALMYAVTLRKTVKQYFGKFNYDVSTLPFKVIANKEISLVETTFPRAFSILIMNPEGFLGWADHLEEKAKELLLNN